MNCPKCARQLVKEKIESKTVNFCPECEGVWFRAEDFAEFIDVLKRREGVSPRTPKFFQKREPISPYAIKEGKLVCPVCDQELQKFNYAADSNIFLDKCPSCKGIWVDKKEVDEMAKFLKGNPEMERLAHTLLQEKEDSEYLREWARGLGVDSQIALFMPKVMVPLGDDIPRKKFPWVTVSIIILCTLTLIGQIIFVKDTESFFQEFGFVPEKFFSIGILTSIFLHGGLLHLAGNMFFLWMFGDNIEDRLTKIGYIFFYVACGLSAALLHGLFHLGSNEPAVGASGAISGIMGAYFAFYPKAKIKTFFLGRIIHVSAYAWLGTWLFFQILNAFISKAVGFTNIAWFAHIGGFIFGLAIALFIRLVTRKKTEKAI